MIMMCEQESVWYVYFGGGADRYPARNRGWERVIFGTYAG